MQFTDVATLVRIKDEIKMAEAKPPSKNCVIPNCVSRYSNNEENCESYNLFGVPKNSLNAWEELMPDIKLSKSSRLCTRHFDDSDVLIGYHILLGVFYPFYYWRLRVGSVPKHHLGKLYIICVLFHILLYFIT
jgi:hypothetical protein